MKPHDLHAKIFLDSGDPGETREIIKLLGFLDGQTTNPTLISKNPFVMERLEKSKFSKDEVFEFYRGVVREISALIPDGSVSVEVYADKSTSSQEMLKQGREMFSWIDNAHVKFPTTHEGLQAAQEAVKLGMRVNMTLCFTQEQAAAVYSATRGVKRGQVFVSPFVGRLDDRREDGMSLIMNIMRMFKDGDGHVEVLTASVRSVDHLLRAMQLGSDIITAPFKVLKEWGEKEPLLLAEDYVYNTGDLRGISYRNIDLGKSWQKYNVFHELTDKGIERFSEDWNTLVK